MRKLFFCWFGVMILSASGVMSQEIPVSTEQQLENLADLEQGETEDDSFLQELEYYRKNPLNINLSEADELKQLRLLTDLQIASLISYRRLFGRLIHLYELQAIPAWDLITIRKLLPFITLEVPVSLVREAGSRLRNGEHSLLLRISRVLEQSRGFNRSDTGNRYLGSPQRVFFRYRYQHKNGLQFGLLGEKDAGEPFGKGVQKTGFDFYSFHFFARRIGIIRSLAIGDFSVNLGQGLIHWQGLAFKKSADVTGIKRQSAILRPYSSAGEFYFNRGAGITIKKGKLESTVFVSLRRLDGNYVSDTVNQEGFISSFLRSGYHRTASEAANRNNLTQSSLGGNISYRNPRWHLGLNAVYYRFSLPIYRRKELYNLYSISGNQWVNASADYSYTYKNLHFFGEAAIDKRSRPAFINGLLISVDPKLDLSVLHRGIHKGYQAVNGNAFTENTFPGNESGIFTGISIRPAAGWKMDAYADLYRFPWLRYQADAPSNGADYLLQLTFMPNRQVEIYTRFRNERKQTNQPGTSAVTHFLVSIPRQSWRIQYMNKINPVLTLRNRVEILWYDKKGKNSEQGFLSYIDIIYKPMMKPFSGLLRLQYFDTDGYNSRIYAYENDVLYSYAIPPNFQTGFRYYASLTYTVSKSLSFWFRWAQSIYQNGKSAGSGLDELPGNRKSEIKLQARWIF